MPFTRIHNFNAGPSILPREVLEEVREKLLDTEGTGLSVMEWSHRSEDYARVRKRAEAALLELLGLGGAWRVLLLQGGASLQFAQVPMNLASPARPGSYVVTGSWASKALKEATIQGRGREAWSGAAEDFRRIPGPGEIEPGPDPAYLHVTSNNTIRGTEWGAFPDIDELPLVGDLSSDILSRPMDLGGFSLIYAGAQKNLGPSGLTVVLIRTDRLGMPDAPLPSMLDYRVHLEADGLYNTPPTFGVYVMDRVLAWIVRQGGVEAMGRLNGEKAAAVYEVIDAGAFYRGTADPASRSCMNVTFRLPTEDLERRFLAEAREAGFVGLKGHRSVGGIRASLYNALPLESVHALTSFMEAFAKLHGN